MFEIKGQFNTAYIFCDEGIENEAYSQIQNFLNHEAFAQGRIAIMPDVHSGKGAVIGFTAALSDKIIPNVIGVDIGCGVVSWRLGKRSDIGEPYEKLDKFIRNNIPSGRDTRDSKSELLESLFRTTFSRYDYPQFLAKIKEVAEHTHQNFDYVTHSLGTLGGGNHFIEIDRDEQDYLWLTIHSGSRNFGLKVAEFHQDVAERRVCGIDEDEFKRRVEEIRQTKKGKGIEVAIQKLRKDMTPKKRTGLEYLAGDDANKYFDHMNIAQMFARLNRRVMGADIIKDLFKLDLKELEVVESVHNYINFEDKVIRKGAISAHAGEKVIIPLNMADGILLGTGLGNESWNNSAPHGAGRKMSRHQAKEHIRLEDFQHVMAASKVWSSCVSKHTLDESPQAYKQADKIIQNVVETITVVNHMRPTYNFKASE